MPKNTICWFEIHVADLERAKKFYNEVFGYTFMDAPYPDSNETIKMSFFNPDEAYKDGVNGALISMTQTKEITEKNMGTLVYFPCGDVSIEQAKIEPAGGKICQPKFPIGNYGFVSICSDTEGNTIGLHSMK